MASSWALLPRLAVTGVVALLALLAVLGCVWDLRDDPWPTRIGVSLAVAAVGALYVMGMWQALGS